MPLRDGANTWAKMMLPEWVTKCHNAISFQGFETANSANLQPGGGFRWLLRCLTGMGMAPGGGRRNNVLRVKWHYYLHYKVKTDNASHVMSD
jgi:hypothetical protein